MILQFLLTNNWIAHPISHLFFKKKCKENYKAGSIQSHSLIVKPLFCLLNAVGDNWNSGSRCCKYLIMFEEIEIETKVIVERAYSLLITSSLGISKKWTHIKRQD